MMMMIKYLIMILMMMLSMGFFLLIERKLMSLIHYRFGPNKVLFLGLFQFLLDLVKLLFKDQMFLFMMKMKFIFCLLLILLISFIFWIFLNFNYFNYLNFNYWIILIVLMLIKMMLLSLFLLVQKSIYIQISFVRVIIQFISYDILIVLMIIFFFFLILNLNLIMFIYVQKFIFMFSMNFYLMLFWIISLMMEILRLPFDFYESESELISGFNLELGSLKFMMLFIMEYLDMIYFLNLSSLIMFYSKMMFFYLLLLLMLILWIRTLVIRFRYDKMLNLMWKNFFFIMTYLILFLIILINL